MSFSSVYSVSTVEDFLFICRLVSANEFHLIISVFFFSENN